MNAHRGHVALRGDDGRDYVLALSMNALCALEAATGEPIARLEARLAAPSATDMRLILWAMLRDHHADLTLEDAGRLAGLAQVAAAVQAAVQAAQPETGGKAAGGSARPRTGGGR